MIVAAKTRSLKRNTATMCDELCVETGKLLVTMFNQAVGTTCEDEGVKSATT
jgi:hypothetical protein